MTPHTDPHGNLFPDPELIGNRQAKVLKLVGPTPVTYRWLRIAAAEEGIDAFETTQSLAGRGFLRSTLANGRQYIELTDLGNRLIENIEYLEHKEANA